MLLCKSIGNKSSGRNEFPTKSSHERTRDRTQVREESPETDANSQPNTLNTCSGRILTPDYNTPSRGSQSRKLVSSEKSKDKTRPFVLEKDSVDCLVDREKLY